MRIFENRNRRLSSILSLFLWMCRSFGSSTASRNENDSSPPSSIFLTKDNYDSMTANKTVFIKWAAPWCGHSQELAPVWDRLVAAVSKDARNKSERVENSVLIAEVDCSQEQEWCVEMGYTAYPTLTYGDGSVGGIFLQRYTSLNKDFDDLFQFYKEKLEDEGFCTPGNLAACGDADNQNRIRQYSKLSIDSLQGLVAKEQTRINEAERAFERRNKELQEEYDNLSMEHEFETARIKHHLKLLRNLLKEAKRKTNNRA